MSFATRVYEPSIDGLRAVAVLLVLLCHVGMAGFAGGFVGVDIFFVISGYLITRNILSDLEKRKFSFVDFYTRRARRIFPAMFFTMVFSGVAGAFLLSPYHFESLAKSVVFSIFGLSNVFFWQEAGYWDITKDFKPLLHFWSLGVEEQFYLFWPALLFGLYHFFKTRVNDIWILLSLSVVSLVAAQAFLSIDSSAAFYLMPFRVAEFGIGGLLLWVQQSKNPVFNNLIFVCSLAAIAFATLSYSEASPFPGVWVLLPCLGAAGIIYTRHVRCCEFLIGNRAMVGIGKISYSLYLIHWPVLVLYKYARLGPPAWYEYILLIAVCFGLAILMYFYIEKPFRVKNSAALKSKQFFLTMGVLTSLLMIPAAHVWRYDGWAWRLGSQEIVFASDYVDSLREEMAMLTDEREASGFFQKNPAQFIIIGDSYANDILNALEQNRPRHAIKRLAVQPGCMPLSGYPGVGKHPKIKTKQDAQNCKDAFDAILNSEDVKSAQLIMFGANWTEDSVRRIAPTIDDIRARTKAPVILFGLKIHYRGDVATEAVRFGKKKGLEEHINRDMNWKRDRRINDGIRNTASKKDVLFVDIMDIFCPDSACPVFTSEGDLAIFDDGHWSLGAARLFGQRFKDTQSPAAKKIFQ